MGGGLVGDRRLRTNNQDCGHQLLLLRFKRTAQSIHPGVHPNQRPALKSPTDYSRRHVPFHKLPACDQTVLSSCEVLGMGY